MGAGGTHPWETCKWIQGETVLGGRVTISDQPDIMAGRLAYRDVRASPVHNPTKYRGNRRSFHLNQVERSKCEGLAGKPNALTSTQMGERVGGGTLRKL
jgi:hypothetical protein